MSQVTVYRPTENACSQTSLWGNELAIQIHYAMFTYRWFRFDICLCSLVQQIISTV